MVIFDSREDVKRFATDQLESYLIERWQFDMYVEDLTNLIVEHKDFYYARDCQAILDYLWADGDGFWPVGDNAQIHCPHCNENVTKQCKQLATVGFNRHHTDCAECGNKIG